MNPSKMTADRVNPMHITHQHVKSTRVRTSKVIGGKAMKDHGTSAQKHKGQRPAEWYL